MKNLIEKNEQIFRNIQNPFSLSLDKYVEKNTKGINTEEFKLKLEKELPYICFAF